MTKVHLGRSLVGLVSLFFMGTGLALMLSPAGMLVHMFIDPIETASGLSSVRALWGGTIVAVWASVLWGVIKNNAAFFIAGFLALTMTLLGRVFGLVIDGSFTELVANIIPTLVALAMMATGTRLMNPRFIV